MVSKLISIIIPSYNMEVYLPKCLGSLIVAPELMERLEVIVVNDGSKDRTSEIAHEFEAKYPGTFKVIDKGNGHYGSCINAGLKIASGKFVRVLDADDYFDSAEFNQYLAKLLALDAQGELDEVDLILTDYQKVDGQGGVLSDVVLKYTPNRVLTFEEFQRSLAFHIQLQAVTYRTEIFRKIEYSQTEGILYTDLEWLTYPMRCVRAAYYLPYSVCRYLIGREGQSVAPEVATRGLNMIVKIVNRMLQNYLLLCGKNRPEVKSYVDKVILTQLGLLYQGYLMGEGWKLGLCELLSLDDSLKVMAPDLYLQSDFVIHSNKFDFHYVREFRRARTRRTLRFFLFDSYSLMVRFYGKIRNAIWR